MDQLIGFFEKATMIDADKNLTRHQKDVKIAQILTDMEGRYEIPLFKNEQWEENNYLVFRVYREIGRMRDL